MNGSENYIEVTSTQKRQILHVLSLICVGLSTGQVVKLDKRLILTGGEGFKRGGRAR